MGYVIMPLEPEYSEYVFQINGVAAVRNYTAQVQGNRIKITSAENETLSLLEADVSEIEIDGTVYTNPIEAQAAINAITYADIPIVVLTSEQRDKIIFKLGEEHAQKNWLLRANGTRVNPESFIPGSSTAWLDMQHAYTVIPFPAMQKNEVKVIRILDQNGTMKQDGWATIGGMNGVKVSNYAMLICMADSAGGTYAAVGYKYAIVGNNVPEPEIITVPTLANLPDEGDAILGVIYLTIDTGNIYYFDASAGDYMQIGSVIEGELINDTTFKDTNQNIVVPDGTHLYKDVENTPERYYKWNGVKYEPFEGSSSGLNWTDAEDNAIPYWNGAESKLKVSKIKEHSKGVVNSGLYIAKTKKGNISGDVQLEDAENFIYTMVGNANFRFDNLSLANDESAVFTMQLTGNFAYAFPDPGIDPLPYIDEYNGSKINYFTIVITETVAGAIKGYYSIQTKQ